MKGYDNAELNRDRVMAYDRALMASRLLQPEFYQKTELAIIGTEKEPGPNKELFFQVCEEAQITDAKLVKHMWKIVVAAKSAYLGQAPGIIW
jgi:hypothetical protein